MSPRILPRPDEDLDDAGRELVALALQPGAPPAVNLTRTMVWNPGILRRWLPYGGKLLAGGKLPVRVREIVILKVGFALRSDYEWSQHVPISLAAGLSKTEIWALAGDGSAEWSETEQAVIDAVDELRAAGKIADRTWSVLRRHFSEAQLVELPLLAGAYTGLAYLLNSFEVEVEPSLEGIPDELRAQVRS